MSKIDVRFYNELFIKKTVNLSPEHYIELYDKIWPCEELFKNFIINTDVSLKLHYAKSIYRFFLNSDDIFLPEEYLNNMIHLQQTKLAETSGYTPQDHIIHSINLYITGIYLFFNVPIFHERILDKMNINEGYTSKISLFVDKFRTFSMYHDYGYVLENYIDKEGNYQKENELQIQSYINIFSKLCYYHVIRSAARLIVKSALLKYSSIAFELLKIKLDENKIWKSEDTILDIKKIKSILKEYDKGVELKKLYKKQKLEDVESILLNSDYLILYFNDRDELIKFIRRNKSKEDIYITTDVGKKVIDNNYYKKYVVKEADSSFNNYYSHANSFFDKLPSTLVNEFKFIATDVQFKEFCNSVTSWLLERTKGELKINDVLSYDKVIEKYFNNAILRAYESRIRKQLPEDHQSKIKKDDLFDKLEEIKKSFMAKNITDEIMQDIIDYSNAQYLTEYGVAYDIFQYCSALYKQITEVLSNDNNFRKLSFINLNNKASINLFSHSDSIPGSNFENELYTSICNLAHNLSIDLKSLMQYKTYYTSCDHGLISAGLLYQAIILNNKLLNIDHNNIIISWHNTKYIKCCNDNDYIKELADLIFAVLLHNIYTKSSKTYGIEYTQQIDVNPFSYFCTFCDNLQKWGRQKQIDFAKIDLPKVHYLEDDFDILIIDGYIHVTSTPSNEDDLKQNIKNSETFLQGIHHIIKVG